MHDIPHTLNDLKARDVNLVSLEERIDTTSASGELVFHVFGAIANFKRRLIFERTRDGLATTRMHRRNPGRPSLRQETVSALQPKFSSWSKTELWQVVDVEPMPVFGKFCND